MINDPSLRSRIASPATPLVVPGGGTPLEARLAQQAGFEAFYLSGYAVAAWRHGLPDIGLLGMRDTSDALQAVVRVTDTPIIVDADTGYGDVIAVTANVRELESIGAAAVQIEDQDWPKKCGHMEGKTVVPRDVAIRKVAAAVEARRDPETLIIARTDSLAPLGLDEAISRAQAFAAEGADIVFIDAPESIEDLTRIGRELPGVRMANMSEGGRTPALSAAEFGELGFGFIIFPTTALRIASLTIANFFDDLREQGASVAWRERMHGLDDLNAVVGLEQHLQIDAHFAAAIA